MTAANTDADSKARERIANVAQAVMQKSCDALNAMVNQIIHNVRTDEQFLGAILTPGVDLNLEISVPEGLEHKVMVLIAECVSQDRIETLTLALGAAEGERDDWMAIEKMLDDAEAHAAEITAAADKVRSAPPPPAAEDRGPGIVMPDGMVRCPNCGSAAQALSKCSRCGKDTGLKL